MKRILTTIVLAVLLCGSDHFECNTVLGTAGGIAAFQFCGNGCSDVVFGTDAGEPYKWCAADQCFDGGIDLHEIFSFGE